MLAGGVIVEGLTPRELRGNLVAVHHPNREVLVPKNSRLVRFTECRAFRRHAKLRAITHETEVLQGVMNLSDVTVEFVP